MLDSTGLILDVARRQRGDGVVKKRRPPRLEEEADNKSYLEFGKMRMAYLLARARNQTGGHTNARKH